MKLSCTLHFTRKASKGFIDLLKKELSNKAGLVYRAGQCIRTGVTKKVKTKWGVGGICSKRENFFFVNFYAII